MSLFPRTVALLPISMLAAVLMPQTTVAQDDAWHTIEFETTQVTQADVALSPDGQWLIFSMLGHLFRLPVEGGSGEQLTFGPYYDTDHAISPDGSRVAFVSDRDGSEGNVFVLELTSGKIMQVTHEPWAGRPTWTPDGAAIVYLSFSVEDTWRAFWGPSPAELRRVALNGGEAETLLTPAREFRSVFFLPDGRMGWTRIEREDPSRPPSLGTAPRLTTRIEVMGPQGSVSILATLGGIVDRVAVAPAGDGLYCRRYVPLWSFYITQEDYLVFLSLPEGTETRIAPVSGVAYWSPRFAADAETGTLYVGDAGRLWKVERSGAREPVVFNAHVKLDVQDPVAPVRVALAEAGSSGPPRVLGPMLSADGRRLLFTAAGYLWQQPLDNAPAQRLFEGSAWETDASLSSDGELAFVYTSLGEGEIRVFDFESGKTRTLLTAKDPENLSWSPDGRHVAFTDGEEDIKVHDLASGQTRTVASGEFHPQLSWSADARQLAFCNDEDGTHRVVAVNLSDGTGKIVAELPRDAGDVLMSADGESLYFSLKRGDEIWVAPVGKTPKTEKGLRRFSPEGEIIDSFAFTADSQALVYSAGHRVWRHPLDGGERERMPMRLELQRLTPPPVLLKRVRVLDLTPGAFDPETSLYIERGRIRWIGSERAPRLPPQTVTLDAGGRFAVPGLFDMHVHGGISPAHVAYGVTSVRDMSAGLRWANVIADRSETSSDPVPRFFTTGRMFYGPDYEGARSDVRRYKERGALFIKVHHPITWGLQHTLADEAHRVGLPMVGHGMTVEEITKSVTMGYTTLEHCGSFYDDLLKLMAAAGTRWVPTMAAGVGNALLLRREPERLADSKLRAFIPRSSIRAAQGGVDSIHQALSDDMLRGRWAGWVAALRQAHRHGVKLLIGTDAPIVELFPGVSVHWELEYFVQAGLTPLEALRIATQDAAEAVGADGDLGTLAPGKLADIVLLDANPLEDIKNTQTIWRVIKGGLVFDPEKLRSGGD